MHPAATTYLDANDERLRAWQDRRLSSAPEPVQVMILKPAPSPGPDLRHHFPPAPPKPWRRPFVRRR